MSTSTETSETNKPLSMLKLNNAICSYKEHFNNTYFLYEKIRLLQHLEQISRLRMCEYLCRFVSVDKKIRKIDEYASMVVAIETCLSNMHAETEKFMKSCRSSDKNKEMVDLEEFNLFITKQLNSIVAAWDQTFSKGIISKVEVILKGHNLEGYASQQHILPTVNINIWAEAVKAKFQSTYIMPGKKSKISASKNDGYCCNWL